MKNLGIGTRLLISFGALLILTTLVGGVAYYGLETLNDSLDEVSSIWSLEERSDHVRIEALQARRAEKDFFMRRDAQYLKKHRDALKSAHADLDVLENETATTTGKDLAVAMRKGLEAYEDGFKDVVALLQQIGDEETGEYGQFRQLSREVEASLRAVDDKDLLIGLLMMRRHEKDYLLRGGEKYRKLHGDATVDFLRRITASGKVAETDKRLIKKTVEAYAAGFRRVVKLTEEHERKTDEFRDAAHEIEPTSELLTAEFTRLRTAAVEQAGVAASAVKIALLIGVLLAALLGITLAIYISRQLSAGVAKLLDNVQRVADGDLTAEIVVESKDEIGALTEAFGRMLESLKESQQTAEERDWLKSGLAQINEVMRGEDNLEKLANSVISEVCTHLDAKVGAFYLLEAEGEGGEEEPALALFGSYAYSKRKNLSSRFKLGEGLVGQSAREQKQILIKNVPDDYVRVVSGLGESLPQFICVDPLTHEGRVTGVIEVGTLGELKGFELDYLSQSMAGIAITLEGVKANQSLARALEQSRTLSEELQNQQAELRFANEELEEQTQALQHSEEKLKVQQEELEVVNEELEEKNRVLVLQKREVEVAQTAIEQKAEELALASKYKSEFLANMSHELRTPLNSLLLLSRSLSDNKEGNLTDGQVESAGVIYSAGNDLLALINEILDLSKIEAGRMSLSLETLTLEDLSRALKASFGHMASDKGLAFEIDLARDAPAQFVTDSKRVQQILKNLVSNALKFTDKGTIHIQFHRPSHDVDLSRSGLDPSAAIAISVTDTGIGIAEDQQKVIFEAFQQADGSTSRRYGGTGLGLSISRELAKLLGGEIQLTSAVDQGSTFTIYLPIEMSAPSEAAAPTAEDRAPSVRPTRSPRPRRPTAQAHVPDDRDTVTPEDRTILIIEDDVAFAKTLITHCHDKQFKCIVATTGEDGLALARKHVPHAVILDIKLPGMDGWDVLDAIKEDTNIRHIPVHVMSVEEPSTKAFRKGAIGHLHKPIGSESLHSALDKIRAATSAHVKRLLVVEDDADTRKGIVDLISGEDVEIDEAAEASEAITAVLSKRYDCMILDLGLWDMDGEKLLDAIEADEDAELPPVIVYTGRDLSREEEMRLREYTESIIIKDVRSEERLLDEVSLFLHRVVSDMPAKKRQVIIDLHNSDARLKGKKILIVEDDMRSAFALSRLLSERQMVVLKAENGQRALEILEQNTDVDLVLMDVMMPVMDGHETTRRIRAQQRFAQLPIIALTAKAMKGDMEKCLDAGANDYLAKPVDEQRLLSMMRVWLYN